MPEAVQVSELEGKWGANTPALALALRTFVLYRAGYAPTDYPSEAEWSAREMIEHSNAAKCPTVAYQLAGGQKDAMSGTRARAHTHTRTYTHTPHEHMPAMHPKLPPYSRTQCTYQHQSLHAARPCCAEADPFRPQATNALDTSRAHTQALARHCLRKGCAAS